MWGRKRPYYFAILHIQALRDPTTSKKGAFLAHPVGLHSQNLPDTLIEAPASMIPLLGLTQYLRGAVVFTLKHTFRSVGLPSFRLVVTTSVKGPVE